MAADDTKKPLVAFLGPPSSYTHQVSIQIHHKGEHYAQPIRTKSRKIVSADIPPFPFPPAKATKSAFPEQDHVYKPVTTIKDVFEAVAAGDAEYGVVPFENSTHGVVTFTLGCLADRADAYAGLAVCGEVYIDVHHYLLGYKQQPKSSSSPSPSSPGNGSSSDGADGAGAGAGAGAGTPPPPPRGVPECDLSHVQRVYSHPQAFGQTQAFLGRHLRAAEAVDVSSTSRAAEVASGDRTGATAAVAGVLAAEAFGLDVLARCIEDRDDNTTRFFVLRRKGEEGGEGEGEEGVTATATATASATTVRRNYKSLVSFTVPHKAPGALATVLDVFRTYGLNLTSINSMPSLIQPFQYLFFVEFEGSREHDPEGKVKSALEEVDRVAESWRWLGSWESQR
ncbi:hypothetical protein VMCG_00649 [Cytospora schulzeri]|uniref:prephenate dehydratase n=1 Tax=Cytospora schulzeri TaxID=448051 RepID=A0A423XA67_9PEZI|nr:hypothetical protein VMCG_00649 [Valsa malicola]